jgi:hypothetical protein
MNEALLTPPQPTNARFWCDILALDAFVGGIAGALVHLLQLVIGLTSSL